jgi:hypothetical protein
MAPATGKRVPTGAAALGTGEVKRYGQDEQIGGVGLVSNAVTTGPRVAQEGQALALQHLTLLRLAPLAQHTGSWHGLRRFTEASIQIHKLTTDRGWRLLSCVFILCCVRNTAQLFATTSNQVS